MIAPGWGAAIREAEKVTAAHAVPSAAAGATEVHGGWTCMFCGLLASTEEKPVKGECYERSSLAAMGHVWVRAVVLEDDDDTRAAADVARRARTERLLSTLQNRLEGSVIAGQELPGAVEEAEARMVAGASEHDAIEAEIARLSAPPIVEPEPAAVVEPEPAAVVEPEPAEPSSRVGQPVDESSSMPAVASGAPAKRGRGRPRKDASAPAAAALPAPRSSEPLESLIPDDLQPVGKPSRERDDEGRCGPSWLWGDPTLTIDRARHLLLLIDVAFRALATVSDAMTGERRGHAFTEAWDELDRRRGALAREILRLEKGGAG